MLVAVGLQVAGIERGVRRHVVLELDDLQFQPVTRSDLPGHLGDLRMRPRGDADADDILGVGKGAARRAEQQRGGPRR